MPDVHWGYGFPIGGVAATDVERRRRGLARRRRLRHLLRRAAARRRPRPRRAAPARLRRSWTGWTGAIPRGVGPGRRVAARTAPSWSAMLAGGARYAVERGYGVDRDLERCEDGGAVAGRRPGAGQRSGRCERGLGQVGSLGSGNHFLEVQVVDEVFDDATAAAFGLRPGPGLRDDPLRLARARAPDLHRPRARRWIAAMPAIRHRRCPTGSWPAPRSSRPRGGRTWARWPPPPTTAGRNRQLLTDAAREVFAGRPAGAQLDAGLRRLPQPRQDRDSTRSTASCGGCACTARAPPAPFRRAIPTCPPDLGEVGQPVLIPGSMGTASYVLRRRAGGGAFHSTCHGAGRTMSRHAASAASAGRRCGPSSRRGHRGAGPLDRGPRRGGAGRLQGRRRASWRPASGRPVPRGRPARARSASSRDSRVRRRSSPGSAIYRRRARRSAR